jgi:WD40 repeat protein
VSRVDPLSLGVGFRRPSDRFVGGLIAPLSANAPDRSGDKGLASFSSDGDLFAVPDGDGAIPVFDLRVARDAVAESDATFRTTSSYDEPAYLARCARESGACGLAVAVSPVGRLVARVRSNGVSRGTLSLTRLDTRHHLTIPLVNRAAPSAILGYDFYDGAGDDTPGTSIAFNDRGDELAIANMDGSVDVYATSSGVLVRHLPTAGLPRCRDIETCTMNLVFSGTVERGRITLQRNDRSLWTWIDGSGRAVPGGEHGILRPSGDRSRFLVDDWYGVRVFTPTENGWHQEPIRTGFHFGAALSPDGSQLVVTDGDVITSYSTAGHHQQWSVSGAELDVWFGADGGLYLARTRGSLLKRAVLRSVSPIDGRQELVFTLPKPTVYSNWATVASNGANLSVASAWPVISGPAENEKTTAIRVWVAEYRLGLSDLAATACVKAGRSLSSAEWARYVGSGPYEVTCPGLSGGS